MGQKKLQKWKHCQGSESISIIGSIGCAQLRKYWKYKDISSAQRCKYCKYCIVPSVLVGYCEQSGKSAHMANPHTLFSKAPPMLSYCPSGPLQHHYSSLYFQDLSYSLVFSGNLLTQIQNPKIYVALFFWCCLIISSQSGRYIGLDISYIQLYQIYWTDPCPLFCQSPITGDGGGTRVTIIVFLSCKYIHV